MNREQDGHNHPHGLNDIRVLYILNIHTVHPVKYSIRMGRVLMSYLNHCQIVYDFVPKKDCRTVIRGEILKYGRKNNKFLCVDTMTTNNMPWKISKKVFVNNSPGPFVIIVLVFLICAAMVVLPAGAANTTQTTVPATTTSVTTQVSTTQTTNPVTSATTTTGSTTQTTIPATSLTSTITTTAAQSQVNPVVAFSADYTDGIAPFIVQFTDMSTGGPTAWNWDFGDGTSDTSQNPSHTYSSEGTYTVRMTATTRSGSATSTREDYIEVGLEPTITITATATPTTTSSASNLLAAFSGSPRSGNAPLMVVFIDTSVGTPISWNWDFGDSNTDTSQNPVHTYKEAGTYTVTLTVNSSGAGKIIKHEDFITVSSTLDSTQPEATLPGSMSNDYQVKTTVPPLASSDKSSGQVSTGKTKTPTPTLTGKAWLEYEKQRMAEVDAIAASQQKKDIVSQIVDFFKGLLPWMK
jgi:PKD repeat protein